MSLWFVPAALGAAGFVPLALLVRRLRRQLGELQSEAARVAELRPLVAEAAAELRAGRQRLGRLSQWRWPARSTTDGAP